MKVLYLIICLFPLLAQAFDPSKCDQFSNDCEYYSCIAEAKHCNRFSYPTNFGKRICLRYQVRLDQFSKPGKAWVDSVRRCLIHEMSQFEEGLSCHGLRNRAFQSHVPCYIDNGYCQLSRSDQKLVIQSVLPGLTSLLAIRNGLNVLKICKF